MLAIYAYEKGPPSRGNRIEQKFPELTRTAT